MNNLLTRFLGYVAQDTQSNENNLTCPSSKGQLKLAELLKNEMIQIGLSNVTLDTNGYLMATLPSNIEKDVPAIGFIAHMDTAQDAPGANVKPQIIESYDGSDIALGTTGVSLSTKQFPELKDLLGHKLITTDGTTLLGGDNKAGIAEILTAMSVLINTPSIKHGKICVGFTPDEEIGRGADLFDVKKFGAQWAYTIDGGPLGELEYENFNATAATVVFNGVNVHPGSAKDKMVNSMTNAAKFILKMPASQTPENTDGYTGFIHLSSMKPSVAKTQLNYILRDFDEEKQKDQIQLMKNLVEEMNSELGDNSLEISFKQNYRNMLEMVTPFPHVIANAKKAMLECGVTPDIKPIRGGTDGARLSFMGLPCPNIFTGGYNFHGIQEFISVDVMEKAVEVIVKLAEVTAQDQK